MCCPNYFGFFFYCALKHKNENVFPPFFVCGMFMKGEKNPWKNMMLVWLMCRMWSPIRILSFSPLSITHKNELWKLPPTLIASLMTTEYIYFFDFASSVEEKKIKWKPRTKNETWSRERSATNFNWSLTY